MWKKLKRLIKKIVRKILYLCYRAVVRFWPTSKKTVVFCSNTGLNYSGNPRYIYEEMVRRGLDQKLQIVWIFKNPKFHGAIPGRHKEVKNNRFGYYYYMCTAGTWVFDSRQTREMYKRKNVHFIQTWHGTPLKKLALDMEHLDMGGQTDLEEYKRIFRQVTASWDYLLSQNPFSSEIFRRAFAFHGEMLEVGYPRNDRLFTDRDPEKIQALKKKLNLPLDKKIILYAPTWRDNKYDAPKHYQFATELDFDMFRERLGQDYVCIVKYHYLVAEKIDWEPYAGFVYQFSNHEDIVDLYLVADLLITDYSSVMFDYSLLRRPMYFFVYDIEEYRDNLRGFYFDFVAEAPGPLSTTTEQLIEDILHTDPAEYQERYDAFSEKFNPLDDGKAGSRVVDLIETWL